MIWLSLPLLFFFFLLILKTFFVTHAGFCFKFYFVHCKNHWFCSFASHLIAMCFPSVYFPHFYIFLLLPSVENKSLIFDSLWSLSKHFYTIGISIFCLHISLFLLFILLVFSLLSYLVLISNIYFNLCGFLWNSIYFSFLHLKTLFWWNQSSPNCQSIPLYKKV